MMKRLAVFLAFGLAAGMASSQSGGELVDAALRRHAPPAHAYEEQALVLTDRQGRQTVRTLRAYTTNDGRMWRSLRVVRTPADARGTALRQMRDAAGQVPPDPAAYRPAFGSAFTVADLEVERPEDYTYVREADQIIGRVPHHVVQAVPADAAVARRTGYRDRLIYLRKDNLFISRIDYRDGEGALLRRQTRRDPLPDDAGVWRPRMILMEDLREGTRALLKIERRVHSPDYVPAHLFSGTGADS